jgi:hypothetical protein
MDRKATKVRFFRSLLVLSLISFMSGCLCMPSSVNLYRTSPYLEGGKKVKVGTQIGQHLDLAGDLDTYAGTIGEAYPGWRHHKFYPAMDLFLISQVTRNIGIGFATGGFAITGESGGDSFSSWGYHLSSQVVISRLSPETSVSLIPEIAYYTSEYDGSAGLFAEVGMENNKGEVSGFGCQY